MSNWSQDSRGIRNLSEVSASATISSNTLTLDLSTSGIFYVNLNSNINTLSITNTQSVGLSAFTLILTADGTPRSITWGASILWPNNLPPTLTSTNTAEDIFSFVTLDGGTTWYGFVGGQKF
jgi:hypothetical protein